MRIGHLFWQPTPDVTSSHQQRMKETLELTVLAEELGYDNICFVENHFSSYGLSPNPVLLAAAMGQHTERIILGTGIAVVPFWNPVRLAEDVATADLLLNGRFEVGLGRGYQQLEFEGLNVPYDMRQEFYEEGLDILIKAWTTTDLEHHGKHFTIPRPINVLPKPMSQPHPKVMVAATSEDSVRAAAATDFKVFGSGQQSQTGAKSQYEIYMEERKILGRPGDYWVYGMNRQVYVIDSTNKKDWERQRLETLGRARDLWRMAEGLRRNTVGHSHGQLTPRPVDDEPADLEGYAPRIIFGTPDEVLQQFRDLRDDLGVQEVNIMTEFGNLDFASARRSIELFGKEVLPALREDGI